MLAQNTTISYHTEAFVKTEVDCTVQGEDYVLVLHMEIIKLLIFGEEYQKKLIISSQHH